MIVRAQTGAEALATLKPFMGEGTLQYPNGTPVNPPSFLSPGIVYIFVPSLPSKLAVLRSLCSQSSVKWTCLQLQKQNFTPEAGGHIRMQ